MPNNDYYVRTEAKDREAFFSVRCRMIFGDTLPCDINQIKGIKFLGAGAYASVYSVKRRDARRGYIVKIKEIKNKKAGLVEYYMMQLFAKFVKYHTPHVAVPMCVNWNCKNTFMFASEYFRGGTMLKLNMSNPKRAKSLIFQVLYSLFAIQMNIPGFRHHDLHLENILIDPIRANVTYELPWSMYKSKSSNGAFMYDLGLANLPGHGGRYTNPLYTPSLKKDWGVYPTSDIKYDHHFFLNCIYSKPNMGKGVKAFVERHLPPAYRGPQSAKIKNFRLQPGKHPAVSDLATILQDPFFDELKVQVDRARYSPKPDTRSKTGFNTMNHLSNIFAGKLPKKLNPLEKRTLGRLIMWGRFGSNTPFDKAVRKLAK